MPPFADSLCFQKSQYAGFSPKVSSEHHLEIYRPGLRHSGTNRDSPTSWRDSNLPPSLPRAPTSHSNSRAISPRVTLQRAWARTTTASSLRCSCTTSFRAGLRSKARWAIGTRSADPQAFQLQTRRDSRETYSFMALVPVTGFIVATDSGYHLCSNYSGG